MKLAKKVLTSALVMGVMMTSMVGCASNSNSSAGSNDTTTTEPTPTEAVDTGAIDLSQSTLDELTITHVTSPLNVPSIIQKIKMYLLMNLAKMVKQLKLSMQRLHQELIKLKH